MSRAMSGPSGPFVVSAASIDQGQRFTVALRCARTPGSSARRLEHRLHPLHRHCVHQERSSARLCTELVPPCRSLLAVNRHRASPHRRPARGPDTQKARERSRAPRQRGGPKGAHHRRPGGVGGIGGTREATTSGVASSTLASSVVLDRHRSNGNRQPRKRGPIDVIGNGSSPDCRTAGTASMTRDKDHRVGGSDPSTKEIDRVPARGVQRWFEVHRQGGATRGHDGKTRRPRRSPRPAVRT